MLGIGAIVLLLLLLVARAYVGSDPKTLVKALRFAGGALLGLVALYLGLTERIGPAIFVGLASWALVAQRPMPWTYWGQRSQSNPNQPPGPRTGSMSREEALKVLGLGPEANQEEIRAAHRRLIVQNHPDKGGSSYLAAKINEAKDVLLG